MGGGGEGKGGLSSYRIIISCAIHLWKLYDIVDAIVVS